MCLDFQGFQYKKIATSWFRLFGCVATLDFILVSKSLLLRLVWQLFLNARISPRLDGFSAPPSTEGFMVLCLI